MRLPCVLALTALLATTARAEDRLIVRSTAGAIIPHAETCRDARLKNWLTLFVESAPTVRISGATIQLQPSVRDEFYDPTYVIRDATVWIAWFRTKLANTVVVVRVDLAARAAPIKLAVIDHNVRPSCGEIWAGTAIRQQKP